VSHDIDEALSVGNNIYVMTQKPMKILKEFVIGAQPSKRQLYDNESVEIKKQILQTIEKW
jgi:ABC-type nitrate/sulfonate/bicarbonate transport system ATPase subunit